MRWSRGADKPPNHSPFSGVRMTEPHLDVAMDSKLLPTIAWPHAWRHSVWCVIFWPVCLRSCPIGEVAFDCRSSPSSLSSFVGTQESESLPNLGAPPLSETWRLQVPGRGGRTRTDQALIRAAYLGIARTPCVLHELAQRVVILYATTAGPGRDWPGTGQEIRGRPRTSQRGQARTHSPPSPALNSR